MAGQGVRDMSPLNRAGISRRAKRLDVNTASNQNVPIYTAQQTRDVEPMLI